MRRVLFEDPVDSCTDVVDDGGRSARVVARLPHTRADEKGRPAWAGVERTADIGEWVVADHVQTLKATSAVMKGLEVSRTNAVGARARGPGVRRGGE